MPQASGRLSEAITTYRRAIARSPSDSDLQYNLGTAEEAAGQHDGALRSYRAALALEPPNEASVLNNIGGVLSALGDLRASTAAYAEAVDADPGLTDGWYNLGNNLLAAGRHAEAARHLLTALRLAPSHPLAHRKLEAARAGGLSHAQATFEVEQQLGQMTEAAEGCRGVADVAESECIERRIHIARQTQERDGPIIV